MLGVAVPFVAGAVQPGRRNAVHHGPVFQDRQVEATPVEADQAGFQALEIAEEAFQQFFSLNPGSPPDRSSRRKKAS